ncbi:hypothetical protein DOK_15084 [gamma proteobacterium BDW918]|jgi:hypothetical protein|uniref:Lipoprotein n=1 Tax=Zhongshania aliphaticivorans TaxID=1470434 RepID=A0A127M8R0_9GAMM|nr:hypothetical protein [Zhongshania aliphaticivorans]AMO69627.1 hypothetical protein AZF00_15570 [Zhongshania aliphaticivorans]EIF42290.1 hypothetical protein DOK_15084 [gamma proteobacterium BDW918]
MLKTHRICIIIAVSIISACGGGGGSGASSNAKPTSKFIENHSVSASYILNRENVPLVAEEFRNEIFQPIVVFDGHRATISAPMPQFNIQNGGQRIACDYTGAVTTTVQDNGGTITLEFEQCKDDANDASSSGTIKSYIYNVNEAAQTYNGAVEFINYQEDFGNRHFSANGTTVFDVRIAEYNIIIVEAETHRNVYDSDIQENLESNIAYAFLYRQLPEYIGLAISASGYLNFENSGALLLSSDQDLVATTLTGLGNRQAFVKLHNNRYSLRYSEREGEYLSIGIPAPRIDDIDAFAANTTPQYTSDSRIRLFYAPNHEAAEVLLEEWFYDAEFNLHNIDVNIVCSPNGAQTNINLEDPFKIKFTSDTYGSYTLNVKITDSDGKFAQGLIYINYSQNNQPGNPPPSQCQTNS